MYDEIFSFRTQLQPLEVTVKLSVRASTWYDAITNALTAGMRCEVTTP